MVLLCLQQVQDGVCGYVPMSYNILLGSAQTKILPRPKGPQNPTQ